MLRLVSFISLWFVLLLTACGNDTVTPQDFTLQLSDTSVSAAQGDTLTLTISATPAFTNTTQLSVTGDTDGVSTSFSGAGATRTLTIILHANSSVETKTLQVRATQDNVTASAALTLEVEAAGASLERYAAEAGDVVTVTRNGLELTYELFDGVAVYQGDMVLGSEQDVLALLDEVSSLKTQGIGLESTSRRWPNGVVPYVIDEASYSAAELRDLRRTIADVQAHLIEHTNIRLVGRTSQSDYLWVTNTSDERICGSSYVGRLGGRQDFRMRCGFGTFLHELYHALGVAHEQSREDRDGFVRINFANLAASDLRHNFAQDNGIFFDSGAYDYDSLMHYPAFIPSWSIDPSVPLITPLLAGVSPSRLGQRAGLSDGDIATICEDLYPAVKPRVTITSPSDGTSVMVGERVQLAAVITDALGVQRPVTARWSSSLDGALRNVTYPGGVVNLTNLTPGTHTLTLETLTDCTNASASVVVTVTGEASMEIISPSNGSSVPRGRQNVEFIAETAGFAETPVIRWESSLDGLLGESSSMLSRNNLSYGTHVITATTSVPDGDTLTDSVTLTITNDAPSVDIIEPTASSSFCADTESITFRVSVYDINELSYTSVPDENIIWTLNGDTIGTGRMFSRTLAAASGMLTVTATDEQGASDSASISLEVQACTNDAPVAQITEPAADTGTSNPDFAYDGYDDEKDMWYKDVTLTGSATDTEDGTLTGSALVWQTNQSSLQSSILGTGNSINVRLYSDNCFGTMHEITLSVTDSDGNTRSVIRRIHIWTLC